MSDYYKYLAKEAKETIEKRFNVTAYENSCGNISDIKLTSKFKSHSLSTWEAEALINLIAEACEFDEVLSARIIAKLVEEKYWDFLEGMKKKKIGISEQVKTATKQYIRDMVESQYPVIKEARSVILKDVIHIIKNVLPQVYAKRAIKSIREYRKDDTMSDNSMNLEGAEKYRSAWNFSIDNAKKYPNTICVGCEKRILTVNKHGYCRNCWFEECFNVRVRKE